MNGNEETRFGHRPTSTNNASNESQSPPRNGCASNEEVHIMLNNLAKFVFGSCASVVEAASGLVPDSWQKGAASCPPSLRKQKQRQVDPRLAGLAGRYQSKSINPPENLGGFPSFLEGESADYSADEDHSVFDDNISALSAFTLEEMARMNVHAPHVAHAPPRKHTGRPSKPAFNMAPPVARISSSSSSSRDGQPRYKFSAKKGFLQEFRDTSSRKWKGAKDRSYR